MIMSDKGPKTLANYVFNSIREEILSGHYLPGSRVDQKLLADELGVSLIPVRESLRQLEAEGLVRIYPHRGVFVAERSADEVIEISRIREALEELATQLAVPNFCEETLNHLGDLIAQMEQALAAQDMSKFLELNEVFHFAIYERSGQKLLLAMIRSLWDRNRLYRQRGAFISEHSAKSLTQHKEIYAACRAGDPLTTSQMVRRHIRQATEGVLAKIALEPAAGQKPT
jgi:DNA-binding GntR family transcriptional regulator